MKFLFKFLFIVTGAVLLQSCFSIKYPDYQAKGESTNLFIDVEKQYEDSLNIETVDSAYSSFSSNHTPVLFDSNRRNKVVKVTTNKKLYLNVSYNVFAGSYCSMSMSFTPEKNTDYRLTAGVKDGGSGLFNHDKCFAGLAKIVNGKLIPVHLNRE